MTKTLIEEFLALTPEAMATAYAFLNAWEWPPNMQMKPYWWDGDTLTQSAEENFGRKYGLIRALLDHARARIDNRLISEAWMRRIKSKKQEPKRLPNA